VRKISSKDNPRFKRWRQLLEPRGIKKHRQFLVCGERIVQEILQERGNHCLDILYPPDWIHPLFTSVTGEQWSLDAALFQQLDIFGTRTPLLVCPTPTIPTWNPEAPPQGLEFLCPLGDPSNVGAVLRTCQALGIQRVILLKESASPFHPRAVRAASGALFRTTLVHGPSIHDLHQANGLAPIVALDAEGQSLSNFEWPKNVRLLVGEEGLGLPDRPWAHHVSIPMVHGMHSLNAVVAASIGLYAYRQQHPW